MAIRKIKKRYAEGGEVGEEDRPEERGPGGLRYNKYLQFLRQEKELEKRSQPGSERFENARLQLKRIMRGPDAGGSERLANEAAADAAARRSRVAVAQNNQRFWDKALDSEGARIGQRRDPTRLEDTGYKKGGEVKKMAKGGAVTRGDGCASRGKTKGRMI